MGKNARHFLLYLLVGLMLLTACGNSSSTQLKECLDLGQKYLTEMNYEEAIIAYNNSPLF